jgi:hypothetical protein
MKELQEQTIRVVKNEKLRKSIAEEAYERSHKFNSKSFERNIKNIFENIDRKYYSTKPILPDEVFKLIGADKN